MKKQRVSLAMLAMVLVFGLASVSCENEAPDNGGNDPDPLPTHYYGCAFSESANTSPRNGTHFFLSIPYAEALEKITQYMGTNDGTAENLNLTSSLVLNKTNWVIVEEEVISASLYHVRLIQDVNGAKSGVYWDYNPINPAPAPPTDGILTITGIPSQYNGKYARFTIAYADGNIGGFVSSNTSGIEMPEIRNGSVEIYLWKGYSRYNATETLTSSSTTKMTLILHETYTIPNEQASSLRSFEFPSISFSKGCASLSFGNASSID